MRKEEVHQRVLKDGKQLDLNLFTWDEDTNTFSSSINGLVVDFNGIDNCTFNTGARCTFKTGSDCTFITGNDCAFDTGSECTFKTGSNCVFNTGSNCAFDTSSGCTFKTGYNCTFKTDSYCTFDTGSECTFKTGSNCVFNTGSRCTFKTSKNLVIVRKDTFEVIQPNENETIKLNELNIKGYTLVEDKKIITIDGKDIEISLETFNKLKKQLLG